MSSKTSKYRNFGLVRLKNLSDVENVTEAVNNLLNNLPVTVEGKSFISADLDAIRGIKNLPIDLNSFRQLVGAAPAADTTDEQGNLQIGIIKPILRLKDEKNLLRQYMGETSTFQSGDGLDAYFIPSIYLTPEEDLPNEILDYNFTDLIDPALDYKNDPTVPYEDFWKDGEFQFNSRLHSTFEPGTGAVVFEGYLHFPPDVNPWLTFFTRQRTLVDVDYLQGDGWEPMIRWSDTDNKTALSIMNGIGTDEDGNRVYRFTHNHLNLDPIGDTTFNYESKWNPVGSSQVLSFDGADVSDLEIYTTFYNFPTPQALAQHQIAISEEQLGIIYERLGIERDPADDSEFNNNQFSVVLRRIYGQEGTLANANFVGIINLKDVKPDIFRARLDEELAVVKIRIVHWAYNDDTFQFIWRILQSDPLNFFNGTKKNPALMVNPLIKNVDLTNPEVRVETINNHFLEPGTEIQIENVTGSIELNGNTYTISVIDGYTMSLLQNGNPVLSNTISPYTGSGNIKTSTQTPYFFQNVLRYGLRKSAPRLGQDEYKDIKSTSQITSNYIPSINLAGKVIDLDSIFLATGHTFTIFLPGPVAEIEEGDVLFPTNTADLSTIGPLRISSVLQGEISITGTMVEDLRDTLIDVNDVDIPMSCAKNDGLIGIYVATATGDEVTVSYQYPEEGIADTFRFDVENMVFTPDDTTGVRIIEVTGTNSFRTETPLTQTSGWYFIYSSTGITDSSKIDFCRGVIGQKTVATVPVNSTQIELNSIVGIQPGQYVQFDTGIVPGTIVGAINGNIVDLVDPFSSGPAPTIGEIPIEAYVTFVPSSYGPDINRESCVLPLDVSPPFIGTETGLDTNGKGIVSTFAGTAGFRVVPDSIKSEASTVAETSDTTYNRRIEYAERTVNGVKKYYYVLANRPTSP